MFKGLWVMVISGVIIGTMPISLFAQEHLSGSHDAVTQATPKLTSEEVVVTGKVICLGCHLKKDKGAKAQCSIYGHTNAIVLEKVIDQQGKKLNELNGKIYEFLHNDQSDKLIKDHQLVGKTIIVVGKIYSEANIIEVNFFKVKGQGLIRTNKQAS